MRKTAISEADLYPPLRDYLVARGYTVRGEVKDCDLTAVRGEELIVIELKLTLNLALVAQAVRRQQLTDSVYVGIPCPANRGKWLRQTRDARKVLRRLELGLIFVSTEPGGRAVEILFHPTPAVRQKRSSARRAVLEEIERRSGDFTPGGSTKRKIMTAYRENAIQIAACLQCRGACSTRQLRELGTGEKTLAILRRNVYGWFSRVGHGVYALTEQGQAGLAGYPELAEKYGARTSESASEVE